MPPSHPSPVQSLSQIHSSIPTAQVLGAGPGPEPSQRSPELALALASGYQHNPEQLLDMQQALFNAPETEGPADNKRRSRSSGSEPGLL